MPNERLWRRRVEAAIMTTAKPLVTDGWQIAVEYLDYDSRSLRVRASLSSSGGCPMPRKFVEQLLQEGVLRSTEQRVTVTVEGLPH